MFGEVIHPISRPDMLTRLCAPRIASEVSVSDYEQFLPINPCAVLAAAETHLAGFELEDGPTVFSSGLHRSPVGLFADVVRLPLAEFSSLINYRSPAVQVIWTVDLGTRGRSPVGTQGRHDPVRLHRVRWQTWLNHRCA